MTDPTPSPGDIVDPGPMLPATSASPSDASSPWLAAPPVIERDASTPPAAPSLPAGIPDALPDAPPPAPEAAAPAAADAPAPIADDFRPRTIKVKGRDVVVDKPEVADALMRRGVASSEAWNDAARLRREAAEDRAAAEEALRKAESRRVDGERHRPAPDPDPIDPEVDRLVRPALEPIAERLGRVEAMVQRENEVRARAADTARVERILDEERRLLIQSYDADLRPNDADRADEGVYDDIIRIAASVVPRGLPPEEQEQAMRDAIQETGLRFRNRHVQSRSAERRSVVERKLAQPMAGRGAAVAGAPRRLTVADVPDSADGRRALYERFG